MLSVFFFFVCCCMRVWVFHLIWLPFRCVYVLGKTSLPFDALFPPNPTAIVESGTMQLPFLLRYSAAGGGNFFMYLPTLQLLKVVT